MRAKLARPNTSHGAIDMPYHSLRRFVGKKEGGTVAFKPFEKKGAGKKGAVPPMAGKNPFGDKGEKPKKFAKGGGIESRGKTRGKMC